MDNAEVLLEVELTAEELRHRNLLEKTIQAGPPPRPRQFSGRGIVICAGGWRYFSCAYVCLRALRHVGCTLPVQVWHLGEKEMTPAMREILKSLGAAAVDAHIVAQEHPMRRLGGWELKIFALIHSSFSEVLLLDADNVAICDPEFLFDSPVFRRNGAIFWPDFGRLEAHRRIWPITGIAYRDEPEVESGQMVICKERCWEALNVARHLNEYSDFYYQHVHGDKETFHLAWRKLEQPYAMPERSIHALPFTMCQHDFTGQRIFQHRNLDKWRWSGDNARVPDFQLESECFQWLQDLRTIWRTLPPGARTFYPDARSAAELAAVAELTSSRYEYYRVGYDCRALTFGDDGYIGEGMRACEITWDLRVQDGKVWLEVFGESGLTFWAVRELDGAWCGRWEQFERMSVELVPLEEKQAQKTNENHPSTAVAERKESAPVAARNEKRPLIVYATIYPSDPHGRSEIFVTEELLREYLAMNAEWDLTVLIGSAHPEALQQARGSMASFPAVPTEFVHFETAYAGRRAEEIAFCKEQLPKYLAERDWDWLLYMDADVWTSLRQLPAWIEQIGERRSRRLVKIKYTLRDKLASPVDTLGAYFHHKSLLTDLEYWRVVFPRDSCGNRKGAPDCNLHRYLTRKGCQKIVPNDLRTIHFRGRREAHLFDAGECVASKRVRSEDGSWANDLKDWLKAM